jgi:hypothetical protein
LVRGQRLRAVTAASGYTYSKRAYL